MHFFRVYAYFASLITEDASSAMSMHDTDSVWILQPGYCRHNYQLLKRKKKQATAKPVTGQDSSPVSALPITSKNFNIKTLKHFGNSDAATHAGVSAIALPELRSCELKKYVSAKILINQR